MPPFSAVISAFDAAIYAFSPDDFAFASIAASPQMLLLPGGAVRA